MWSYVSKKVIPDGCGMRLTAELGRYWLMCLAGVMTNRFSNSKLEPFGIKSSVLMDGVPTKDIYQRKCMKWVNGRLKVERKHLRLRTRIKRLARRTICFSKSEVMHDLVIGLINRYEFGISI